MVSGPPRLQACTWAIGDATGHASFGIWQGSNDIDGLQRCGVVCKETCWGHDPTDTEIATFYMS